MSVVVVAVVVAVAVAVVVASHTSKGSCRPECRMRRTNRLRSLLLVSKSTDRNRVSDVLIIPCCLIPLYAVL